MRSIILLTTTALLIVGCSQKSPTAVSQTTTKETNESIEAPKKVVPQRVYRKFVPKRIDDTNYNADYAYPEDKVTKVKPLKTVENNISTTKPSHAMSKEACITMIGEEKFNKYTQMLGSEASSIKRCAMLKAMKK